MKTGQILSGLGASMPSVFMHDLCVTGVVFFCPRYRNIVLSELVMGHQVCVCVRVRVRVHEGGTVNPNPKCFCMIHLLQKSQPVFCIFTAGH